MMVASLLAVSTGVGVQQADAGSNGQKVRFDCSAGIMYVKYEGKNQNNTPSVFPSNGGLYFVNGETQVMPEYYWWKGELKITYVTVADYTASPPPAHRTRTASIPTWHPVDVYVVNCGI